LALPVDSKANQYFTRIDFNATRDDKIAFTSFFTPAKATSADRDSQSRPVGDLVSDRLNFAVGLIYIRSFSSTKINEARFNYSGWGFNELESNPQLNFGLPRTEVEGIAGFRLRYGARQPGNFKDRQYDFRDVFTMVVGNHVLKLGGSFRHDVNAGGTLSLARPVYSFVRPWNLANGTPVFEGVGADINGKPSADDTRYHTNDTAFFVQDDWKFRPNLTLNFGLRWEYFSPITVDNGAIGNLLLDANGGLAGAKIIVDDQLTDPDKNNFGPQLGFAWSPTKFKDKLVIRGGGGIAYDRLANALLDNARRNPGRTVQQYGPCCAFSVTDQNNLGIRFVSSIDDSIFGYPVNPSFGGGGLNPVNGLPLSGATDIWGSPRRLPNASVYRYSLEAQYEIFKRTVATLGYQGSLGRNFVRIDRVHITGPSTNPNIGAAYFARPDVNTEFNALLAGLRTRFYRGLDVGVNYRFAKSLDTSSFEAPCGCTDQSFPVDQRQEHGPSDFDVRHSLTASAVWDIPFYRNQSSWAGRLLGGWQLSTIITYNTGFPWTPKLFGCLLGTTTNNFCDPRPTVYNGVRPLANSDDNFLQPGGVFPGGGGAYFNTSVPFNDPPFAHPPAIGRNSLFGPKYFATDLSIIKRFGLPSMGFLGEAAGIDLRFNFFNVFNNLNLTPFNSNSDPTRVSLQTFGTATSALSGRVGEFQIRFSF
jgi:hypothetical protein